MQPQTTTTAIVGKGLFSIRKIGCELGMRETTLQRQLGAVKKKAAAAGTLKILLQHPSTRITCLLYVEKLY